MIHCARSDCSTRPTQTLLHSTFNGLGPNTIASFSFKIPGDVDSPNGYEASVHWTPEANSTLLAIGDRPCSAQQLQIGGCGLATFTGSAGEAHVYPPLRPGTSYVLYVLNVGANAESGSVESMGLGGEPASCVSLPL
jgi:hypothetical protein